MAATRSRCLDQFNPHSFQTKYNNASLNTSAQDDSSDDDDSSTLPSTTMTTPEYLRIHANAPPSKLRDIIKKQIFPHDDVEYLKRLVGDVGHMEFVFRFLWYDGPKPVSSVEWGNTSGYFTRSKSSGSGWNESSTRTDGNWSTSTYGFKRSVSTIPAQSTAESQQSFVTDAKEASKSGRTWIQYCCYYNAHQCLKWIFREIVNNHLNKFNQKCEIEQSSDEPDDKRSSKTISKESDVLYIIKQLLEYPSHCYCASNYVGVATICNSHDCLLLLLQYGGLDPNMQINSHGSTAAHLAAWKNNVECLQVLKSGCYDYGFSDNKDEESYISEEFVSESSHDSDSDQTYDADAEPIRHDAFASMSDQTYDADAEPTPTHRDAFTSMLAVPRGRIKTWAADWNVKNSQGETPMHVAAREGSCEAMQFFLDLAVSFAETEAMREDEEESANAHGHDTKEPKQQHENVDDHKHPPDFSLRNKDGLDVTALAAQNNHARIVEILASDIHRIQDIEKESTEIKQSASDGFWNQPLDLLGSTLPQDRSVMHPHLQSQLSSLRRRANTDPVRFHVETKPSKAHISDHNIQSQSTLPRYFPSLNLHNPLEKNNYETPIHVAARQGNVSVIKALFDSGCCNTSARDSLGHTALHIAVLANRVDVCRWFSELNFEQFAKFDVVDILGRTPLYIACSLGIMSIARILTPISNWRMICHEKRQAPDSPLLINVAQQTPLHAAVVNNHVQTVGVLLECGVDVDQFDVDGRTAINAAAKLGYYDMCQMLILHGANVNARSSKGGPTPYQKAKKYKHGNVADLLYEFGGR